MARKVEVRVVGTITAIGESVQRGQRALEFVAPVEEGSAYKGMVTVPHRAGFEVGDEIAVWVITRREAQEMGVRWLEGGDL